MTHAELVQRAARWLKAMGCPIVFAEFVTMNSEIPDAIGWRNSGGESLMIECKASRSDFRSDRHKAHRWEGTPAVGSFRYYMTPPGLVKPEELPARWGLLYCHEKTVEIVSGKHPKKWTADAFEQFGHKAASALELRMLYSALNRLRIDMGDIEFRTRVHLPYAQRKRHPEAA